MKIGNHRAPFIDYRNPGIFMITMSRIEGIPDFSRIHLKHNPLQKKLDVGVKYYDLGFTIFHQLRDNGFISPKILLRQYIIMPDHIHLLVEITERLDQPLGYYIAIFKRKIYHEAIKEKVLDPLLSKSIFKNGFNDQFLRSDRDLDTIYQYIKENPYRLWIRKEHPEYFQRIRKICIGETVCSLYGNFNLLQNPFIFPVVIHRKDSDEDLAAKKELWRYGLANGRVLVGAFIAKPEKSIFNGAAEYGGKIILISNTTLAEREKPTKMLFELCEKGQLLIISPEMGFPPSEKGVSRRECLLMNSFAESLAKGQRTN